LYVLGKILKSNGEDVRFSLQVVDISGRKWMNKIYRHRVKERFHKDLRNKGKDAYQPIFTRAAEDVAKLLRRKKDAQLAELRAVTEMRFAQSFAADAFAGYLRQSGGVTKLSGLPDENDPMLNRTRGIRVRDSLFIDNMQTHYENFDRKMSESYAVWQAAALTEAKAARKAKKKSIVQGIAGAAALIGGIAAAASTDNPAAADVAAVTGTIAGGALLGASFHNSAQAKVHREALAELDSGNRQSELYLTDIVAAARRRGLQVEALRLDDAEEALGVNDRAELARACAVQRRRNVARWLAEGVSFTDPATAYVDTQAELGPDCVIGPGVVIAGASRLGRGVQVKAHSVIEDSLLEDGVVVGPCAHLRPGATLRQGARVGNFVEVKNSELGPGVKADHLAYIGDADVGANSSFGCGAITVNYDWEQKHRTRVGAGVRIGCNANLIAPVALADGAYVAAGATVTKPVPGGAIAVSSGRQRNIEGFGKRRAAKARARDAERG